MHMYVQPVSWKRHMPAHITLLRPDVPLYTSPIKLTRVNNALIILSIPGISATTLRTVQKYACRSTVKKGGRHMWIMLYRVERLVSTLLEKRPSDSSAVSIETYENRLCPRNHVIHIYVDEILPSIEVFNLSPRKVSENFFCLVIMGIWRKAGRAYY